MDICLNMPAQDWDKVKDLYGAEAQEKFSAAQEFIRNVGAAAGSVLMVGSVLDVIELLDKVGAGNPECFDCLPRLETSFETTLLRIVQGKYAEARKAAQNV